MSRAWCLWAVGAAAIFCAGIGAPAARAQEDMPSKVQIVWNRYHTYDEIAASMRALAAAYPDLVELRSIGRSLEGREMWLAIVTASRTGPHRSKPAMWIDGNVHANEIQAAEVVLYSMWYLTKAYGVNERLTEMLDTTAFYLVPVVNPDSRAYWFESPSTPHFPRHNQRPEDNDLDGLTDEDPADDLDGDGHITGMWRRDPNGRWLRSQTDPRVFTRVKPEERGEWTFLGQEGIDNDGDGDINEDGPGGDDMNRNWPGDWRPKYVQHGAGPYPFSAPETRAIGLFILDHPNIAAVQSYHNAGGMILRGPGAAHRENVYPQDDRRVYDEIGRAGEQILPYYRYLIIYKDLYTVYGGFVNWTAESLGIFSFTNEMWTPAKYFQRDVADPDDAREWFFRDRLQFGQMFTDYTPYDHPAYGEVLVGGLNKWSSRSTPTFMLEEECHRNFAFTMYHAGEMPRLRFDRVEVEAVAENGTAWSVTVEVRNDALIPTRSGIQTANRIGTNDILECKAGGRGGGRAVAAGRLAGWFDERMTPVRHEPERVLVPEGVPGRGGRIFRFIVEGREGDTVVLRYRAEKAKAVEREVELRAAGAE